MDLTFLETLLGMAVSIVVLIGAVFGAVRWIMHRTSDDNLIVSWNHGEVLGHFSSFCPATTCDFTRRLSDTRSLSQTALLFFLRSSPPIAHSAICRFAA